MSENAVHYIEKYSCFSRMIKIACIPKYTLLRKLKATTRKKTMTTCQDCLAKIKELK